MFIYAFIFTMLGLADGHTLSQPSVPTRRALVFILCQLKTGISLMIDFLLAMGAQVWVHIPLCCPTAAPFLGAVSLSLEILISGC